MYLGDLPSRILMEDNYEELYLASPVQPVPATTTRQSRDHQGPNE